MAFSKATAYGRNKNDAKIDPKRTFGMSKNKSPEVRIPPAPLMISDGGLGESGL